MEVCELILTRFCSSESISINFVYICLKEMNVIKDLLQLNIIHFQSNVFVQ